jgi:hypothetical protein
MMRLFSNQVGLESPNVTLEDNSAVDDVPLATGEGALNFAPYVVHSTALNLGRLSGNTATGSGMLGIDGSGAVVSSTFAGGALPLIIPDISGGPGDSSTTLDVPSGVTATLEEGTVLKGQGPTGCCTIPILTVEGTFNAVGTSGSPITITSIEDNSVGGTTGNGTPAPGDWQGIQVSGSASIDLEHANVDYTSTGVSATTSAHVTVEDDKLQENVTALDINATLGTNAAIHGNWFDQNAVALAGSSDWDPVDTGLTPCQYVPSMSATENLYGAKREIIPYVSTAELATIYAAFAAGALESPDVGLTI